MKKIFITGPESCGKTSLSEYLHLHLPQAFLHKEYAREYLESKNGFYNYSKADLKAIVEKQEALWKYAVNDCAYIIFDTDPLVLKVWIEEVYQEQWPEVERMLTEMAPDITLLCKPDIIWEPDPLRENPNDRQRLFDKYENYLKSMHREYFIVSGEGETRHANTLELIESALPVNQAKQQ